MWLADNRAVNTSVAKLRRAGKTLGNWRGAMLVTHSWS